MEDALLEKLQNNSLDEADSERIHKNDDSDVSDNDDHTDNQQSTTVMGTPMMRHGGRQTGPKGVIDDQKHQQRMDAIKKQSQQAEHNAKLLARAPMTTTYLQDQQQQQQMELVLESKSQRQQRGTDDSDDDLLDDEEVLKAYRTKRLAELKQLRNHKTRKDHRVFGTVQEVDADDYVTAIDNEWRTVPVIVHLYDDRLEQCRHLDLILQGLARKYSLAKVIRVSALDLAFDLVGSPALLGYKSGMLIANLVRLDDELGPGAKYYTAEVVEDILLRHDVLSDEDQYDIPRIDDDIDDDD